MHFSFRPLIINDNVIQQFKNIINNVLQFDLLSTLSVTILCMSVIYVSDNEVPTSGGLSVGIVRLRTTSHGVF
jgi:hypothetical protein